MAVSDDCRSETRRRAAIARMHPTNRTRAEPSTTPTEPKNGWRRAGQKSRACRTMMDCRDAPHLDRPDPNCLQLAGQITHDGQHRLASWLMFLRQPGRSTSPPALHDASGNVELFASTARQQEANARRDSGSRSSGGKVWCVCSGV
jgi:hypothetical protein